MDDIQYIRKSIRTHLADLHVLFTNDAVNIDLQYYNAVTMALLAAEDAISKATVDHINRTNTVREQYVRNNRNVG